MHERFVNPNPNRRGGFVYPNRETRVSYLNHGRKGGYPNPHECRMKDDVSFFSENLDIEFFLSWIY